MIPKKTLKELQDLVDLWIDRLGMGEWKGRVVVFFKSASFVEGRVGSPALAATEWSAEDCTAKIYMTRGQSDGVLLHELLHIFWQGHTTYVKYDEMVERSLNRMSAALLALTLKQQQDNVHE